MKAKYGPVFRVDGGPQPTVVLADVDIITAAGKGQDVAGRPYDEKPSIAAVRPMKTTNPRGFNDWYGQSLTPSVG